MALRVDAGAAGHERHREVVRKIRMDKRRRPRHRELGIDNHRQRVVLGDDGVGGVAGNVAVARHDHGDRLARVTDRVHRHRAMGG